MLVVFNNEKEASSWCVELWVIHRTMNFSPKEKRFAETVCANSKAVLNHIASWTATQKVGKPVTTVTRRSGVETCDRAVWRGDTCIDRRE